MVLIVGPTPHGSIWALLQHGVDGTNNTFASLSPIRQDYYPTHYILRRTSAFEEVKSGSRYPEYRRNNVRSGKFRAHQPARIFS